jgi:hypothetical protein
MSVEDVLIQLVSAEEASRDLDLKIARHVQFDYGHCSASFRQHELKHDYESAYEAHRGLPLIAETTPLYTSVFDAALTLLPRNGDYEMTVTGTPDGETFTCVGLRFWLPGVARQFWHHRDGCKLRPAHALCIAAMKYRAALWAL